MTKTPKVYATHVHFGQGEVLSIRTLDGGALVADVRFTDKSVRVIRLVQQYWLSNIAELLPTPPKKKQPVARAKRKPSVAEPTPAGAEAEAV